MVLHYDYEKDIATHLPLLLPVLSDPAFSASPAISDADGVGNEALVPGTVVT
jgi:hypothetical protein